MEDTAADASRDAPRAQRSATTALLLATLLWGCGFTWAKTAGETANRMLGIGEGAAAGPVWVLAVRFLSAGVLWLLIFRDARRGWDWPVAWRSVVLGSCLSGGMVLQHLGLDRTSEAVSAFLTSLTILFVPLLMTLVLRRPPPPAAWAGVIIASVGVWLMTGASAESFGAGEMLGLACAVAYSVDIVAVNLLVRPADVARVTAGQFFVVGAICLIALLLLPGGRASVTPTRAMDLLGHSAIGANVALLAVLASMGAFGLQFRFQPRIDPTRAALLYLVEPIFALAYAWIVTGRRLTAVGMLGAAMILVANVLAEVLQSRKRTIVEEPAALGAPVID